MNTERDKSVRVVRRVDTGCVVVVAVLPRDCVSAARSCVICVCHHCTLTCVQEKSAGRGLKGSLRGTPRPGRRTLRQRAVLSRMGDRRNRMRCAPLETRRKENRDAARYSIRGGGPGARGHICARGVSSRVRAASGDQRVKLQAWIAALRYIWQRLLARTVPLAAPSHARVFHSKRTIISQCPSDVS